MKPRTRTTLIVAVTLAGLLVFLTIFSSGIILRGFSQIEEQETARAVKRGVSVLSETLDTLDATCGDWAHRDDTYAFASAGNPDYVGKNLTADTFRALKVNLILIADTQGRIVHAKMMDYPRGREIATPPDIGEFLVPSSPVRTMKGSGESRVGVIILSMGQLLFAAHSITTSDRRGPIRGFLIMGRFLDAREEARLARVAGQHQRFFRLGGADLPDDVRSASISLLRGHPTVVRPVSGNEEAGYALIRDLHDRPALILRVNLPRTIHRKGIESIRAFILMLLLGGLVVALVMETLLERTVISRLTRLHNERDVEKRPASTREADGQPQQGAAGRAVPEETLPQPEDRFRRLFVQSKDVIIITSGDNLIDLNPAGLRMLGLSKETVRQGIPLSTFFDPVDCQKIKERIAAYGFAQEYETYLRMGNGEKRTVLISATGTMEDDTHQMVCQGIIRDVTAHRQMERQRAQVERMESIGNLAGGMTHDFNNILTAIMTHLSQVNKKLPAGDPLRVNCDAMEKATNMGSELIASLMAFTHGEPARLQAVDLNVLVEDTISIIRRTFSRNIQIETSLAESLPIIEADGVKMKQAIMNLCINARDAMPDGGTLTVATALEDIAPNEAAGDPEVKPGRFIVLSASDTGLGMSRETMQRMFEPFFTTKPAGKGTGLGLSVVYGVVKGHRGFITVDSNPGKGTTFRLHFPIGSLALPA